MKTHFYTVLSSHLAHGLCCITMSIVTACPNSWKVSATMTVMASTVPYAFIKSPLSFLTILADYFTP